MGVTSKMGKHTVSALDWVVPRRSLRPRNDPDIWGRQATRTVLRVRSKDWESIIRELSDPGGALGAVTGYPRRCLILTLLFRTPERLMHIQALLQGATMGLARCDWTCSMRFRLRGSVLKKLLAL